MIHSDLLDVCAPYHGGVAESVEANARVAPSKADMRSRILAHVANVGDCTCDEVEVALGMPHQTCSARFAELHREGQIVFTGNKRPTRSGCNARVFRVAV